MEHSPPPFFKRGPAPLVRLFFFASLSLALLVIDAHFRYAEGLRRALALVAYPLQRAAVAPIDFAAAAGLYVSNQVRLAQENAELRARVLALSSEAQRFQAAEAETERLRQLESASAKLERGTITSEILYAARDPYSRKIFIDRGARQGVKAGSPVTDADGVVGQVTRVEPLLSEVTLLTDRDQAIPVQVLRTGLRAIAFGGGPSGMLELRYMPANAEIQIGDQLVTSGLDGTYPAGLPVASVVRIERDPERSYARVVCQPAAGVDRGRYVLVLMEDSARPRPQEATPAEGRRAAREPRRRRNTDNGAR